ncbi:hypothetical protein AAU61_16870 [Desulfocarbo indianensis]|nr:hypothetical protein AAU61_16870 [Desulfocarbo indianensis]
MIQQLRVTSVISYLTLSQRMLQQPQQLISDIKMKESGVLQEVRLRLHLPLNGPSMKVLLREV